MESKKFICVCGAEFDNAQKFNSHKSHCKEHYLHKYGDLAEYNTHKSAKHEAAKFALHTKANAIKQDKLDLWISEQHKCERCGKVMTEKFGSGRFCSRACANARDLSDETKEKISKSLSKPEKLKVKVLKSSKATIETAKIEKEPTVCLICGEPLGKYNTTGYCTKHLNEHKQQLRLQQWLETGDIGLAPDTTIRGIFRQYILEQQNHCCAICGMPDVWHEKPLMFVLDHIDGDAANSARSNLRLICPNCDSQLDTYKAKNKNSARTKRKKFLQEIRAEK